MTTTALFTRSATLAPSTLDEANRTVEAIISTGAPVARRDAYGPFMERLSLDPAHVDLSRLKGGPVLDTHRQGEVRHVLGRVVEASTDGTTARATLKFSSRPDVEPIWQDVKEGTLRALSIGYAVARWQDAKENGLRTRTATAWDIKEVSLVPLPADAGATIRSEPVDQSTTEAGGEVRTRADINRDIRNLAKAAGIAGEIVDGLVDREASVEDARASLFDELVKRGGQEVRGEVRVRMGAGADDPHARAEAMGEALFTRAEPSHQPSERARAYIGLSIPELAKDTLSRSGVSVVGMAPASLVTRAMHTTSDFPLILGNVVNRTLRAAYAAAPSGIRQLSRETSVRDFRAKSRLQIEGSLKPQKVNEAGEYTHGTFVEAGTSYRAERFGRIVNISVEAMVNDDLGAFSDLSRRYGIAAAAFEAEQLAALVEANPTMNDGNPLFSAPHGNAAATGTAPGVPSLSAARLAMRRQKSLTGEVVDAAPRYLIVPPELETEAEQLLADIAAANRADVNPVKVALIVEPRLTSPTGWYVVADPAQIDGLEHCYVEGMRGPIVTSERDFDTSGLRVKVEMTFGGGFVDWRGWYRNAGA